MQANVFKIILLCCIMSFGGCNSSQPPIENVNPARDSVFVLGGKQKTILVPEFSFVGRVYFFCKIWGFLKFHNQKNNDKKLNEELPGYLQKLDTCYSKGGFNKIILDFIAQYDAYDPHYPTVLDTEQLARYSLIDNGWMYDTLYLDAANTKLLVNIWNKYSHVGSSNDFLYQSNIGCIEFDDDFSFFKSVFGKNKKPAAIYTRLVGLFNFWNLVYYFYPYKNLMSQNWDSTLLQSIPLFYGAKSDREYNVAILKLKAKMDDNHAVASSPILQPSFFFGKYVCNFDVEKLSDTFCVSKYRVKDYIDSTILPGDKLISINGINVSYLFDSLSAYFSCSNEDSKNIKVSSALLMSNKSLNQLLVRRNGREVSVSYKYYASELLWDKFYENQDELAASLKNRIKWYDGSCAYTHIDWLTDKNINSTIQTLATAKSIIIDFRGYPTSEVFFKLCDFILPNKSSFFLSYYPDKKFPGVLHWHPGYMVGNDDSFFFKGKVVLLVDATTQSLAEFAVMALRASRNVTIVGSKTAGTDGNVTSFYFPDDVKMSYTGIGILYPDFFIPERKGIRLDIVVKPSYASLIKGRDVYLDTAITFINAKSR